ncbi:MAG: 23S rRNA (guanosine(2251)-2'-O)-methyltransferase RlmB [Mycetocola sp.]
MGNKKGRPGAVRKTKKTPTKGTGGNGRQALEGKGPTPKAEDRTYHVAGKRKLAQERLAASRGRRPDGARGQGVAQGQGAGQRPAPARRIKQADDSEIVTGRNSVLEALRSRIPATTLYIATRIEMDDRVKEIMTFATRRGLPILEVTRPELDRLAGIDSVHQGVAIKVPPYEYAHPEDLIARAAKAKGTPLIVALDGITDPRNLGAIIRSSAAFGANGVLLPQRRSVGLTASAWKTSAGAAARVPVAMASNLTRALQSFKEQGYFVIGLDGGGDTPLPGLPLADRPLVVVVGNEGKGLSRLVTETCDAIVSIPISAATESLNAGIATSVALYEIAKLRSE